MLFLAWLSVSFIIVAAINIYLRHFGFPRQLVSSSTVSASDGRVSSSGYFGGTTALSNTNLTHQGESAKWINNILTWICQQAPSTGHRNELVDSWLKALTQQAQHYSTEVRIQFDDIRGTLPEFSNFSVVDPSTAVSGLAGRSPTGLTLNVTVNAKDVTLQICIITQLAESSRTVYADVYLLHLHGQLKVIVSPSSSTTDQTPVQSSFASTPELRLQILPSGRLDSSTDVTMIEKVVRAAIAEAVVKVTWSQTGGFRSNHVSAQQPTRIDTSQQGYSLTPPSGFNQNQQYVNHATSQQGFIGTQPLMSPTQLSQQPMSSLTQSQSYTQSQQPVQYIQQQSTQIPTTVNVSRNDDMLSRPSNLASQDSFNSNNLITQRLIVKVLKANGLADDQGSCNSYCVVRVDHPAQILRTGVMPNTFNPIWDEQLVFDIDNLTRQIQFDVLDRDKQPDRELLGKAVVHFDEIRRMPSSRQILPLTGRLRNRTATSGSVTAEFALMETTSDTQRYPVNENVSSIRMTSQQATSPQSTNNVYPMQTNSVSNALSCGTANNLNYTGTLNTDTTTNSADASRLSAHDLALLQQQQQQQEANRSQESPTFVVTGSELQRSNAQGTLDGRGRDGRGRGTEKESFASALKKRLSRGGGKKRSQSADRAQPHSQSLHETNAYLRPPGDSLQGHRTTDTMDIGTERNARSNSFTSSLRRIFKPSSTTAGGKKDLSREGSLTRNYPSPEVPQQYNYDRTLRQNTPVPPDRRDGPGRTAAYQLGISPSDNRAVDQYGRAINNPASGAELSVTSRGSVTMTSQGALSVGRY